MGRIPIENNHFISRDTQTHPSETVMMKGNIILEMDIYMYICIYEIRDCQDPVKGSGWVLFPSTMAEQPIQQMVVRHMCFQERAEQ